MGDGIDRQALDDLKQAVSAARGASTVPASPLAPGLLSDGSIDQTVVAFNVFSHLLASDGIRAAL